MHNSVVLDCYYSMEYSPIHNEVWGICSITLSVPHNIVMYMNNVMMTLRIHIWYIIFLPWTSILVRLSIPSHLPMWVLQFSVLTWTRGCWTNMTLRRVPFWTTYTMKQSTIVVVFPFCVCGQYVGACLLKSKILGRWCYQESIVHFVFSMIRILHKAFTPFTL